MTIGIGGSAIQDELKSLICIKNKIKPLKDIDILDIESPQGDLRGLNPL